MRKMHQTARAMMRAISSGRRKSAEAAHLERALGKIVFRESKGVQGKMDRPVEKAENRSLASQ
jgi:hypothetical protein